MTQFNGILVPIITPFSENGDLEETKVTGMVDYLAENGIQALFVGGSYGGFALLDIEERIRLNRASILSAKSNNMKSLVNCATTNLRDTVKILQEAEADGADAVCFMAPYYYSNTIYNESTLARYTESVLKVAHTPVFIYNNPRTTGFDVSISFIEKLAGLGVSGIKDSSDSIERIAAMLHRTSMFDSEFEYITGSSIALSASLSMGSKAAMSGVAVAFPALNSKLYQAVCERDQHTITRCYDLISRIREIMTEYGSRPIAFYSLLKKLNIDAGVPRAPWYSLSDEKSEELYERLDAIHAFDAL